MVMFWFFSLCFRTVSCGILHHVPVDFRQSDSSDLGESIRNIIHSFQYASSLIIKRVSLPVIRYFYYMDLISAEG